MVVLPIRGVDYGHDPKDQSGRADECKDAEGVEEEGDH